MSASKKIVEKLLTKTWTCHNTGCSMWSHSIRTTDPRPKCDDCGRKLSKK